MRSKQSAFIIMDAVVALFLLAVLMTVMAIGLTSNRKALAQLANTRDACNTAERVLTQLQQGNPIPDLPSTDHLQIERLNGGTIVPDYTAIRVSITHDGRTASLVGLVKTSALKGA